MSRYLTHLLRRLPSPENLPSLSTVLKSGMAVVGVALTFVAVGKNWLDIPSGNQPVNHYEQIVRTSPGCQSLFQSLILLGLTALAVLFAIRRKAHLPGTWIACSMLMVALSFPYFALLQSPVLAADATWLQMQHDGLTWLGGDINSEAESGNAAWKSKVYLVDPPRQVAVAPIPTWSALEIGLDKSEDVLSWIGYSNVFCQFVRSGWFAAISGSFILVILTCMNGNLLDLRRAGSAILLIVVASVVGIAWALSGPFASKAQLQKASNSLSLGDYEESLSALKKCESHFPALAQDSYFIAQRAILEHLTDGNPEYSDLHRAKSLEQQGKYDQSFQIWSRLCHSRDPAVRRESLRAAFRFAVQDFNCHRIDLAQQRMEFVLHHQPGNVKAIYYLQIVGIRKKDYERVAYLANWMDEVTGHLNFNTTKILNAVSHQNARIAATLNGDPMATWTHTIEAK